MWFVSKKKYDEMERLCKVWKTSAEGADKRAEAWERVAISCQKDNKRLVAHEEEMLAKMKELETELQGTRRDNQQWAKDFKELDSAYGQLEIDCDRLREERDHYEERCRYLEGEIEDKEELEAKLAFVTRQRDYYYDLLETTSETKGDNQ